VTDPDETIGCILAFDFGLKHIGIAVGQSITATASPLTTIRARDGKPDWVAIQALIEEWQPARLLVGLPLNMDDSESEMSLAARRFGARLARRSGLDVTMVDERLTSFEVKDEDQTHAAAAALIARTWLAGLRLDQRR
jgi:putative Holliday junction resolvase